MSGTDPTKSERDQLVADIASYPEDSPMTGEILDKINKLRFLMDSEDILKKYKSMIDDLVPGIMGCDGPRILPEEDGSAKNSNDLSEVSDSTITTVSTHSQEETTITSSTKEQEKEEAQGQVEKSEDKIKGKESQGVNSASQED